MKALSRATIILCAGKIDPSNLPIGTNVSNATIPVNGKPVIAWILDDLMRKQVYNVIIVAREEDKKLQKLLTRVYAKKMQITIVCVSEPKSILESLSAGLEQVKDSAVQVILGDTLIRDNFDFENDTVYVGEVKETKRWCLAIEDHEHHLVELIDKQDYKNHSYHALAGYYFFADAAWLKDIINGSNTLPFFHSFILLLYSPFIFSSGLKLNFGLRNFLYRNIILKLAANNRSE